MRHALRGCLTWLDQLCHGQGPWLIACPCRWYRTTCGDWSCRSVRSSRPARRVAGTKPVDDRAVFIAIVYVLTSGCAWRDLPPSFGVTVPTAHRRFTTWTRAGLWRKLTETCDDVTVTGLPRLVTNVATTDATVTDVEILEQIHTDLNRRGLLPGEHIVDAGYTSADLMISARRDFGVTLLGPLRIDNSEQARAGGGFDRTAFTIEWDHQRVTCPQGVTNTIWSQCTERGRE